MKKIKFHLWALLIAFATISFVACSDDDKPNPNPDPEEPTTYPFHIWASLDDGTGNMTNGTHLVKGVTTLEKGEVNFVNEGVDVTELLTREAIIKGQYYYQIRKDGTRFGKYRFVDEEVETIAEFPFTTLKVRRHTHAWIDDNTLVLIGSNGPSDKIVWVKVNTETMTILSEGELDLPAPQDGETFNTAGIASYRKTDGTLLYSFLYNPSTGRRHFYMAFINPSDMSIKEIVKEERAEIMAGTAYGELLQEKSFFTSNGDYYLACNNILPTNTGTSTTQQSGTLLRIKNRAMEFDPDFAIHTQSKIIWISNLDNLKALVYYQDPEFTGAPAWGDKEYNSYHAILDLQDGAVPTPINDIPVCKGVFSQRSVIRNGKAYIGTTHKGGEPTVYIYDIATGNIKEGLKIRGGYIFDRIVALD